MRRQACFWRAAGLRWITRFLRRQNSVGESARLWELRAARSDLTVFRLISDAPSGLLLARGRITLDNTLLAATELSWGICSFVGIARGSIRSDRISIDQ